jgi:hypothetical protein
VSTTDLRRAARRAPADSPVVVVLTLDDGSTRTAVLDRASLETAEHITDEFHIDIEGQPRALVLHAE